MIGLKEARDRQLLSPSTVEKVCFVVAENVSRVVVDVVVVFVDVVVDVDFVFVVVVVVVEGDL